MEFKITKKELEIIRDYPHLIGHLVGKNLLIDLHSKWIHYLWDSNENRSLQGHRGSYKTTAIIIIGCIYWLLFHPNDRIAIVRKSFTDAADCLTTIRSLFKTEAIQVLFTLIHKMSPKAVIDQNRKVTYNFKKTYTPEGSINAYGIDTGITGKHFDKILCDDFCTLKDRTSQAEREKVMTVIQEIMTNVVDPGKSVSFVGTPWHKQDAWSVCPEPIKFDWRTTKLLSEKDIMEKRKTISSSLFAANYELTHIASEDALFTNPSYARWKYIKTGVFGQLDAKYFGDHTNALTFMCDKKDGRYQAIGFCFSENIKEKYQFVYDKWKKYFCGSMFLEDNADKGFVADELRKRGIPVVSYHENTNKHVKIDTYLLKLWNLIDWDSDTDPEYMNQIIDYVEGQEPDDACFVAGTKVMTLFGNKNIENIKTGDLVLTPFGFKKVLASGCTGIKNVIKKIGLTGTSNHKIYNKTENKFTSLDSLTMFISCDIFSLRGLIQWKIKQMLFLMDKRIQNRDDIIFVNFRMQNEKTVNNYIKLFGNFIIKEKFQKGFIFIIKILIQIIMTFLIWNWLKCIRIFQCMLKKTDKIKTMLNRILCIWIKSEKKQKYGIEVQKEENGIKNILWFLLKKFGLLENKEFVFNVKRNIQQNILHKNIVLKNVEIDIETNHLKNIENVLNVEKCSLLKQEQNKSIVPINVNMKHIKQKEKVYNLKIEDVGVYYANNILVSNCDSAASLIRAKFYKKTINNNLYNW